MRRELAEAVAQVAEAGLVEAELQSVVALYRLAAELELARERLEVADQVLALSEELFSIVSRQVDAGELSPLALLTARSELAQVREMRIMAARAVTTHRIALAAGAGWPQDAPLELDVTSAKATAAPPFDALLALAERQAPVLRRLHAAEQAAQARRALAEREAWPEPTVGMGYAREGGPGGGADIFLLQLGLPLPLWDRNQGGIARAYVEQEVAQASVTQAEVDLRARLAQAKAAVDAAAERVGIYGDDVLPLIEEELARLQRAYQLGELGLQEITIARQRLLDMERAALQARAAYVEARASLVALVGCAALPLSPQEKP